MIGMNKYLYQAICLSFIFGVFAQATQAAALQQPSKLSPTSLTLDKYQSPIEKALSQQKRDRIENKSSTDNPQIKVLTTISVAPTQNFFAEQHQRFSRFVQNIFPQHSS